MKSMCRPALATVTLGLLLSAPCAALAGWAIEEVDPDFPQDRTTLLFSGQKVRVSGLVDGLVFLVDLAEGKGYVVDEKRGLYAGGTVKAIGAELRERGDAPSGEGAAEYAVSVLPPLQVAPVAGEETVAGRRAEGYRVLMGDLLVEELWIAPSVTPPTEGPSASLFAILEVMTGGGETGAGDFPPPYEEEAAYREVLLRGYPVRRVRHYRGETSVLEVTSAEQGDFPDDLFAVPPGFTRRDYRAVFFSLP